MKLVRFEAEGKPVIGAVIGDGIVRISDLVPEYRTIIQLAGLSRDKLAKLSDLVSRAAATDELTGAKLLAPIERPGKFLAIGMNYRSHTKEAVALGQAIQPQQMWFNKQTTCLSGPYDDIDPGVTKTLDYEIELGFVIGQRARYATQAEAPDHVFGYYVANDVSAREWQLHSQTFTIGKSFDTHGPIGPWIVTSDEIADPHNLDMRLYVNGKLRQEGNTSELVYNIWAQIEYLSTAFTLDPGDLFVTGTPEGVGHAMKPPVYLQPGDVVRCEIDGIGVIENKVINSTAKRYPELKQGNFAD